MRKFILTTIFVLGIVYMLGSVVLMFAFGFTFGNLLGFFIGGLFVTCYFVYSLFSPRIKLFIKACSISILTVLISMIGFIILKGMQETTTFKENSVLVLGCGIKGEEVLPLLQARLDKCIDYIQKNSNAIIVVSGGQGSNESISEAEAMKRYLVLKGIDESIILKEDKSKNTKENMLFSKQLFDSVFSQNNNYTTVCITNNYHAYRANKLALKTGFLVTNYNAEVVWYLAPAAYCREVLSIFKFWIFD